MKAAFDRIVHEHGATVLRMTRSMLSRADADDARSETFLAALRAYPGLPADANVEAWLVTIARRKSIDIVRAADRHAIPVAELPDQFSEIGIPDGHDLDLARLIATLPEKQRRAVTLHYLAGMPHQHVADLVGDTVGDLLLAATDVGLVRVAYAVQDHDGVLDSLARNVSSRVLRSAKRLDEAARELDDYFSGMATSEGSRSKPSFSNWRRQHNDHLGDTR
jgi:RNA polymerase sigma factor (sigma-70 family)